MYGFAEFASCFVPTLFVIIIFGAIVLMRWFKHREIVTLAEKGLLPDQYSASRRETNRGALVWGVTLSMLGLALIIGLWPIGLRDNVFPLGFGPWMLFGLVPLFIGLALLIVYIVTRKEERSEKPMQEPLDD